MEWNCLSIPKRRDVWIWEWPSNFIPRFIMDIITYPFSYYRQSMFVRGGAYNFIHYDDVIMTTIASQITSLTSVYSTDYSAADQRKHQSSASLAFVWGIHRGPVNSPHKGPVTRKMFPFDDVIMFTESVIITCQCPMWLLAAPKPSMFGMVLIPVIL